MQDPFASLPVVKKPKKKPGPFDDVQGGSSSSAADPFAHLPTVKNKGKSSDPDTWSDLERQVVGLPPKKPKPRLSFLAPIASGATLGASDEILGAVEGANEFIHGRSFKEGYERGKQKTRDVGKEFKEDHPVLSPALDIAAGLAAPVGAAKYVKGAASTAARIGRSALSGAGIGAGAGAASADDDNRLGGAVTGAAFGGVIGGAIPAVGKTVGGIANQIGLRSKKGAESVAVQKIIENLRRDKITPQALAQAESDALSTGTPVHLFDVAGQNTLGLARAAQAVPSKARDELPELLHGRHTGQADRIFGQAEQAMGVKGRDLHEAAQEIMARARAKAKPLYDAAHPLPITSPETQVEIAKLMDLSPFRSAMKRGAKLAAIEGNPLEGDVPLTVKDIDYMKRGLDAIIESRAGSKNAISRTESRALRNRLNEVVRMVDAEHPEYQAAREAWAGDMAHSRALEMGSRVFGKSKKPQASIEKRLASMSDSEREVFKLGTLGAIRDILNTAGDNADKVRRLLGSPKAREAVRAVIGDLPKSAQFSKAMDLESKAVQSKHFILGNSQTARILADMDDMTNTAISMLGDAATGNVGGLAKKGLGAFIGNRRKAGAGRIAEAVNRRLQARPGTPQYKELMDALSRSMVKKEPTAGSKTGLLRRLSPSYPRSSASDVLKRRLLPPISLKNRTGAVGYHGSDAPNPIESFNIPSKGTIGTTFGNFDSTRHGAFFSNSPEFAGEYGKHVRSYDVQPTKIADTEKMRHEFVRSLDPFTDRDMWLLASHIPESDHWGFFENELGERFTKWLKSRGYDAAQFHEYSPENEIHGLTTVALDPSIVKPSQRGHTGLKMLGGILGAGAAGTAAASLAARRNK